MAQTGTPTSPLEPRDLTPEEYGSLVRQQIAHEDDLINHRLTWLIIGESIFFGSYAQAAESQRGHFVGGLALIMSFVIYMSLLAAVLNLYWLRGYLTGTVRYRDCPVPNVSGGLKYQLIRALGLATPVLLPPIFIFAWLWLLRDAFPHW